MLVFSFFFQAEDGIRDHCVTGVQTCALPICSSSRLTASRASRATSGVACSFSTLTFRPTAVTEIGRASCRERVWIAVDRVSLKKKEKVAIEGLAHTVVNRIGVMI